MRFRSVRSHSAKLPVRSQAGSGRFMPEFTFLKRYANRFSKKTVKFEGPKRKVNETLLWFIIAYYTRNTTSGSKIVRTKSSRYTANSSQECYANGIKHIQLAPSKDLKCELLPFAFEIQTSRIILHL